jgi:hypothetical protein
VDVEAVGLRIATLVTVRGSDEDVQVPAGRDLGAGQLGVPDASARNQHDRRLPAQPLLDRGCAQLRPPHQLVELIGVRE